MHNHITRLQFTPIWPSRNEQGFLLLVGQALSLADAEVSEQDRKDVKNASHEVESVNAKRIHPRESSPAYDKTSNENTDSSDSQSDILTSFRNVDPNNDRISWAEDEAVKTHHYNTCHDRPSREGVRDQKQAEYDANVTKHEDRLSA